MLKKIFSKYFPKNELVEYFILSTSEPSEDFNSGYQIIKNELLTRFYKGNFSLDDSIFNKQFKESFTFNWNPKIDFKSRFWIFVKINLLFRLYYLSIEHKYKDLKLVIKDIIYQYANIIYSVETNEEIINYPSHRYVYHGQLPKNIIKHVFYRNKNHLFWEFVGSVRNNRSQININLISISKRLMSDLKIPINHIKKMFKTPRLYSFGISTVLCIVNCFLKWKLGGSFFDIWEMIPLMNYLYYLKFTDDNELSNRPDFLKYVPLYKKNVKDEIFDGSKYLIRALNEDLPYTSIKETNPVVFILKIALPKRHVTKNSYKYVLTYYKDFKLVKSFLNSCIINTIVGCYPGLNNNNKRIFNNLSDISLLLKFYNKFVFNDDKEYFIKELCDNQLHLKCIIRQFIIYTIKNNCSIPILKKFWENTIDNVKHKIPLNFKNFVQCNNKNIHRYRNFYYFKTPIVKWSETIKKKREKKIEDIIVQELKKNIRNDLLICKLFSKSTDRCLIDLPLDKLNKINYLIERKDISLWDKISKLGLHRNDIKILKKVQNIIDSPRNKISMLLEDLSCIGKSMSYHFFSQLSKFRKINFYTLNIERSLTQHTFNILFNKEYFEKLYLVTCCDYPRICNKSGNQTSMDNENGLHKVSIGINNQLKCSDHNIKNNEKFKRKKNHEEILNLLMPDIILTLKKIFKYTNDRRDTFQLYQYLLTKYEEIPEWFDKEEGEEDYENFCDLTGSNSKHYKPMVPEFGYLKPKIFSLPITYNRKKAKDYLIKLISSNKIQLKTILNKHTRYLIKDIIFDKRLHIKDVVGKYIVIETKKKSKKKKKKNTDKKEKKNNIFKRVFCLCDECGELKLYNNQLYNGSVYLCKDCYLEEYPKIEVYDEVKLNWNVNNRIPIEYI